MKHCAFLLPLFIFCFTTGCNGHSGSILPTLKIAKQADYSSKHAIGDKSHTENQIILQANLLLNLPFTAVTQKPSTSQLTDPRTYVSMACYWWPDPNSEDGTPYIRIDGEVNPETRSELSDLPKLIEMAQKVELLASAFKFSGDKKFARKALDQLTVWFITKETAMHPHLEHAQMIKGRNHGRSFGVIDTWWLVRVVEFLSYLEKSSYWTIELKKGMQAWFTHYLNWLRNSEFGQTEMRSKNNHGTWYDLQVVTFARFVNQRDFAKNYLSEVTQSRISRQITLFGRQKFETRRPRPLHYSIYNLSGLMKLALHGKELNVILESAIAGLVAALRMLYFT